MRVPDEPWLARTTGCLQMSKRSREDTTNTGYKSKVTVCETVQQNSELPVCRPTGVSQAHSLFVYHASPIQSHQLPPSKKLNGIIRSQMRTLYPLHSCIKRCLEKSLVTASSHSRSRATERRATPPVRE